MANLFFPQLATGALAQYPIRKLKQFRSVMNVYGDNSITAYSDSGAATLTWQLSYAGISAAELTALRDFFSQCSGMLLPFTFIDPTDNMLASSVDLTATPWVADPSCSFSGGMSDPVGTQSAFKLSNASQVSGGASQTLAVPANYQYCFSVYVRADTPGSISLSLSGTSAMQSQSFAVTATWSRIVLTARLNDGGTAMKASLQAPAGSSIEVFGPQLEAQMTPSGYRSTTARGGVYPNCHWTNAVLPMTALGPSVFATEVGIETIL